MTIQDVRETIDDLLTRAVNAEDERLGFQYHFIADYYRINAELDKDKRKVVLNTLQAYPDVQLPVKVNEISEQYSRIVTRNSFRFLTEWSLRYGSTGKPPEKMAKPDTGERVDETDDIVNLLNTRIDETSFTVNDAALALNLASLVYEEFDENEDDSIFETTEYEQTQEILDAVTEFIELKQPDIDWDMLGGSFHSIRNQTQQDIMKDMGKRKVIRELRNFESDSIEEFLEQRS